MRAASAPARCSGTGLPEGVAELLLLQSARRAGPAVTAGSGSGRGRSGARLCKCALRAEQRHATGRARRGVSNRGANIAPSTSAAALLAAAAAMCCRRRASLHRVPRLGAPPPGSLGRKRRPWHGACAPILLHQCLCRVPIAACCTSMCRRTGACLCGHGSIGAVLKGAPGGAAAQAVHYPNHSGHPCT